LALLMLKEKIEIMRHERNTPLPLTYPYRRWTKKLSPSCHVMSIFTPVNKAPSGDWDRQVEGAQNSLHGLKGFSIRREVFLACTLSMSAKLSPDRIFHPTSRENDIFDSIPKIPVLWPARNLREIWPYVLWSESLRSLLRAPSMHVEGRGPNRQQNIIYQRKRWN
jgi:hypothetical protein